MRLLIGPAIAVMAVPCTGFLKFLSYIGTGLLQPILATKSIIAPIGSIWTSGLRVILPSAFAVESPSLYAVHACAYSCTVEAINIDGIAKSIQFSVSMS